MERENVFDRIRKKKSHGAARKRKLYLELHRYHAVPLSFLEEAMDEKFHFSETTGGTFGMNEEGYVRQCYLDLKDRVFAELESVIGDDSEDVQTRLVEIRGSSGVGKSAFIAYILAVLRREGMENIGIFHATKSSKQANKVINTDEIFGSIWIDGKLVAGNCLYVEIRTLLYKHMAKLDAIFMDGCSMNFSLADFRGIVIVAASPSMYTRNLRQAILKYTVLNMPTWSKDEVLQLAQILDVDQDTVEENMIYMEGIVRYMLTDGLAKEKVLEAVGLVNAKALVDMLSTQMTDKTNESIAVHSLVRWNTKKTKDGRFLYDQNPSFDMVSRFAEKQVAEKLATLDAQDLKLSFMKLQPLSGAEGYAGALFEAYAVRRFLSGGDFSLTSLKDGQTRSVSVPALPQPVVVECNTLSLNTVPLNHVRKEITDGEGWQACLLWPTTSNFPTFDSFYFHTDGEVYSLQMTISSDHPLNSGGSYQATQYFSNIDTESPYPAVFVVPAYMKAAYKKQKFAGKALNGKKVAVAESDAVMQMDALFEQWVLGL